MQSEPATLHAGVAAIREQVATAVVGQQSVVDEVLLAMLAGGHALLVGVPGLAKTMMVRSIAQATHLTFNRVQFTPDLVPSDITGTEIMEEDPVSRARSFRFLRGPIFAQIVLADEINRAPPRTQAALLEAMQEHSVTAAGETMRLPEPFFVLATQNPIEQEGTYPLPEAQLDRFLFEIRVNYPSEAEEVTMLKSTTRVNTGAIQPVLEAADMIALQRLVRATPVAEVLVQYVARLVRATRPAERDVPPLVQRYVRFGAGPRAGQALILGAKAHAVMNGRAAVTPSDIHRVAYPVLRHRVLLGFAADADRVTTDAVIRELLETVPPPESGITV